MEFFYLLPEALGYGQDKTGTALNSTAEKHALTFEIILISSIFFNLLYIS